MSAREPCHIGKEDAWPPLPNPKEGRWHLMPCKAGACLWPELLPCFEETNLRQGVENLQPKGSG